MIGLLDHPKISRSQHLASEVALWLRAQGHTVWQGSIWQEDGLETHLPVSRLLVVLGGDGSILRAARLAAPHHVPIFSINLGKVGFLSEAQPEEWAVKLAEVVAGRYWLERRLMLTATVYRAGTALPAQTALNEVVVGRGRQARVIRVDLSVNDDHVTTYLADGVIAATPTGSTAYALAAGGPILAPDLANYLLIPVAPHWSLDRALVLPHQAVVRLQIFMDHEATLTADGQTATELVNGDEIVIQQAAYDAHFARVNHPSYFFRRLVDALGKG